MAIGALAAIPELQAEGPARIVGARPGLLELRFLASGASMTAEAKTVVRYALFPGTAVGFDDEAGASGTAVVAQAAPHTEAGSGLIVYPVTFADGSSGEVREDCIEQVPAPQDASEQLRTLAFHELRPRFARAGSALPPEPWGPQNYCAREALLDWRDGAWSKTGGVTALAGARVRPLPHQLLTAQRVLADREVRFLLADEVGLGKTIEAGLIMQSLLANQPAMRVLVIAPGALVSQWFLELYIKFGGRRFVMLDAERIADHEGNPWAQPHVIASSQAIEHLQGPAGLQFDTAQWDMVIIDECHRMHPDGALYRRIAALSERTPHVLLLSATPDRHHEDAYLALLHLLEPDTYDRTDVKGFQKRLKAAEALEDALAVTRSGELTAHRLKQRWKKAVGADEDLEALLGELAEADTDEARAAAVETISGYARERYDLERRVIRHRRE
ncbi:MAG: SNF2-related protein, partial [Planctomycetota bacterium]